jgi:hypothetical protein
MKHSVAQKLVKEALSLVNATLRLTRFHEGRLPSSPKTEVAYNIDTGPGTVHTTIWIKNGRLMQTEAWDPYPYTYWDLSDPNQVATWAKARESLPRRNEIHKEIMKPYGGRR